MNAQVHIADDLGSSVRPSARVKTIAARLEMDESSVRRLFYDGEIEGFRIGKRGLRIFLDSVADFQERRREAHQRPTESPRQRPKSPRTQAGRAAHAAAMARLRERGLV